MTTTTGSILAILAVLAAAPTPLIAAIPAPPPAAEYVPQRFVSVHDAIIAGHRMRYQAKVEEWITRMPDGAPGASIVTTSYERTGGRAGEARPVIFAFNGGPGSASIWLHLGLVGPRRIAFNDPTRPETTPPFRLTDNDESPLDVADIVLIDPPGTGFSTILPAGKPAQFYGVHQDAELTVQLIERWIRDRRRWNSAKYLLSESYGTIRAAAVSRLLAGGPTETGNMDAVTLNGVILIGQAMDTRDGGDGRYLNVLPSLAATACHFGKGPAGCTSTGQVAAAQGFAADAYLRALAQGARLSPADRAAAARELSRLIGLPESEIQARDLRIGAKDFAKLLLAADGREIGLYDARYTLPLKASGNDPVADDPAMGQYVPGFVAALNTYLRDDLGVTIDRDYIPISFRAVNSAWDYGMGPGIPPTRNFAEDLAVAMRRNPSLRLMVGTGLYDLVTPLGSADYVVAHAGIPLERTELHLYESGHAAYLGDGARKALAADVRAFVSAPSGGVATAPVARRK